MRRWLTLPAIALGVGALALMAAMSALGWWQLGAYDKHQAQAALARLAEPPVQLDTVLGPDSAFPADGVGRPVTTRGRYAAGHQFYVENLPGSQATYAVVTPLTTASGSMILVVRGASSSAHASVPSGVVTVRGVLQPSQATAASIDRDQVTDGIRIASVLDSMPRDLYAGYVLLTTSRPAESLPPVRPPLPESSKWAGLRNLLYAIQWWVFAAFVAFMWWRIVREGHSRESAVEVVGYGQTS